MKIDCKLKETTNGLQNTSNPKLETLRSASECAHKLVNFIQNFRCQQSLQDLNGFLRRMLEIFINGP